MGLSHLQLSRELSDSYPMIAGQCYITSYISLGTGFVDNTLIALLPPNLVIVFHAAGFVRFRLLQTKSHQREKPHSSIWTYPHLWLLEILAAPIVESALEGKHVPDAHAGTKAEDDTAADRVHRERAP